MDYLSCLDLYPGNSLDTAEKNFRKLALKYHPDKNPGDKQSEEKFKQIVQAFEAIRKNPSILDGQINTADAVNSDSVFHQLKVSAEVSLEEIYMRVRKSITINRQIFCPRCDGSGSELGESGKCDQCGGEGNIDSSILSMLGESPVCPACDGFGVKPGTVCPDCRGRKRLIQKKTLFFTVDTQEAFKGCVILKGVGNQFTKEKFGDVRIILKILKDSKGGHYLLIEEDCFSVHHRVSPVQKILGDVDHLNIFGRRVPFKIKRGSDDSLARDVIRKGLVRHIKVFFIDHLPKLTEKTLSLYSEIMAIEKEQRNDIYG